MKKNRKTGSYKYRGYTIERGGYYGTCDDRADRWYCRLESAPIRHIGGGTVTLKSMRQLIDNALDGGWE